MPHLRSTFPAIALFLAVCLTGCKDDGLSDYERLILSQQKAADELKQMGGEAAKKTYPQGEAWVVKLSGAKVTDEVLGHLKKLQRVAELDLSHSTITDAQIPLLMEAGGVLFKLDLSNTAITDTGIAPLADLVLLAELNLTGDKVTPAAVAQFKAKRQSDPKIMPMFKATAVRQ